jgi:hypothetical protein
MEDIRMYLRETVEGCELDSSGSGYGTAESSCEHGNELSSFIKSSEYLD